MRKNVIGKILDYIDIKNSPNGIQNSVNILIELASRRACFDIIVQPLMMEPFFAKLFDGIDNIDKKETEGGEDDIKKAQPPSIVQVLRRQGVRLVSYLMQNYSNFILKDASKNEEDKKDKKDDDDLEKDTKENFTGKNLIFKFSSIVQMTIKLLLVLIKWKIMIKLKIL